jgi:hypothetical protein
MPSQFISSVSVGFFIMIMTAFSARSAVSAFSASRSGIGSISRRSIRHFSTTTNGEQDAAAAAADTTDAEAAPAVATGPIPLEVNYSMEEIVSLCKRRGIIFPSSEIYNGYAGFYDYGPLGSELKKNVKDAWWKNFVTSREDVVGLDSSIVHNPKTWKSSGMYHDSIAIIPLCIVSFLFVLDILTLFLTLINRSH